MISHGRLSPLDREIIACLRASRSEVKLTFSQWLEQKLWIPSGPYEGLRFSFDRQPVTRLWADCIDSGLWSEFIHTGPSQYGKSLLGYIAPMIYHLAELGEHVVMGVPMSDMAAAKWERDILPTLKASPELRHLVPVTGSGSAGGKVRDMVTLGNSQIIKIMTAGGDDVNKASFTSRIVAITEAARFSEGASSSVEADPFTQLKARQRAYEIKDRRTFVEGTLTIEEELPWCLRETSTKSRILTPCPHCEAWILPGREHLKGWIDARSDREAIDNAYFVCPECGHKITTEERAASMQSCQIIHEGQEIDKQGRVTGPVPSTMRLWFHVQAWHNLLLSPGAIAADEWNASRIPEDSYRRNDAEKQLCQFVWSMPYLPKYEDMIHVDYRYLWQRQASLPRAMAPADTMFITTGVDMGTKVGWYLSIAVRSNGQLHVLDYDLFEIPSESLGLENGFLAALRQLRDFLQVGYSTEDGRKLPPQQIWVDAGFGPAAVLKFVAESGGGRDGWIFAAIGRGESQMSKMRYERPKQTGNLVREIDKNGLWHLSRVPAAKSWEITFNADQFKLSAQAGMVCDLKQPGAITLFSATHSVHERICKHWTNEQIVTELDNRGQERQKWHRKGPNHLFDALAIAIGAATRLGYEPMQQAKVVEKPFFETNHRQDRAVAEPEKKSTSADWYGSQVDAE